MIRQISILFYLVIFFFYSNCNYSQEVKKESVKIFDSHKKFMTELSFVGVVYEKNICVNCKINKYTLKIGLIKLDKKTEFSNTHYPPYYFFEKDSILNISVDETLFNGVEIKDTVTKKSKSLTIDANQMELQYLNNDKKEWLPIIDIPPLGVVYFKNK